MGWLLRPVTVLMLCLAGTAVAADPAADLKRRLDLISSLRADFTQEVLNKEGDLVAENQGFVQMKKPDQIVLFTATDETVLFLQDDSLCFYDPFVNQVTVMNSKVLTASPFGLLISNDDSIWERYEVSFADEGSFVLKLKNPGDLAALEVTFNGSDEIAKIAVFMTDGTVNSYNLSNVTDKIIEDDFAVDIPPDAEFDYGRQ